MTLQQLIENVLSGFYKTHKHGEALLNIDLHQIVESGYLISAKYADCEQLKEEYEDLLEESRHLRQCAQHSEALETEIYELNAIISKFETK